MAELMARTSEHIDVNPEHPDDADRLRDAPPGPPGRRGAVMLRATRSELTRLNYRSFRLGWLGLTALLTAVFTTVVFAAATILGVVTLAYWAIATASDYSTGLIRLLVQAEPHRLRLLCGKVFALTAWTAVAATVATLVSVALSPPIAQATGLSTSGWNTDPGDRVTLIASRWLNTFGALIVWGVWQPERESPQRVATRG